MFSAAYISVATREQVMAHPEEFERGLEAESHRGRREARGPESLLLDEVSNRELTQARSTRMLPRF
jgi:hypothetical protein